MAFILFFVIRAIIVISSVGFYLLCLFIISASTTSHYCRIPAKSVHSAKDNFSGKLSKTLFARVSGDPFQLPYEPSSCSDDVKE